MKPAPRQHFNDMVINMTKIKTTFRISLIVLLAFMQMIFVSGVNAEGLGQATNTETPTNTPTETPSNTPSATPITPTNTVTNSPTSIPGVTQTPIPTDTPEVFVRPLVVLENYTADRSKLVAGKTVTVTLTVRNKGKSNASNVVISFVSGDLVARGTGGVQAIGDLAPGASSTITQDLTAASTVDGKSVAYITASVSYTDGSGTGYSSDATLAFNISMTATSVSGDYYASATPTSSKRPQVVISGYQTDVDPLQPGTEFTLALDVKNVGSTTAKNITMVMGGGSASTGDSTTPVPGGVAGASGEFTNFAPIGASNIQSIGNLSAGDTTSASQKLIVNVSTNPGTYPVKFSYLYTGDNGQQYQDDQVITLLVYRLPLVEVNFYRAVDPLMVGMPGMLPIQVVNLSRSSTILGNMVITTGAGEVSNNSMLVGTLDAGGYFPMDVSFTPSMPGKAEILITLQYTDDFNQPRQIEFKLNVDIAEAEAMETPPGMDPNGGMMPPAQPETFWQKVVRFFKGLFGLDSAEPTPTEVNPEVPMPGGGGGGGGEVYPGGKGLMPSSVWLS